MANHSNNMLSLLFALFVVVKLGASIDLPDITFESGKVCGESTDNGCAGVEVCLNSQDVGNWLYGQDTDSCSWCDEDDDCSDSGYCLLVGICEYTNGEVLVDGALCTEACSMCISAGENENYFLCGCVEEEDEEEEEEALVMPSRNRGRRKLQSFACPEEFACYAQPQLGGFCIGEETSEPCISSYTTLDVFGKGPTPVLDLQVGDKIMTNNAQHEEVFAFGHSNAYAMGDFFQIKTEGKNDNVVLEITGQHLMFKDGSVDPVPVSVVSEKDLLSGAKVTQIERLSRQGLYSPLVKGGVFQAGGVMISSYTAISNTGVYATSMNIGTLFEISFHTFQHMALSPYRMLNLLGFSPDQRNWEGQLLFVAVGEELVHSFLNYGIFGQFMASAIFLTSMGPIYFLENTANVIVALFCFSLCIYSLYLKE